MSLKEVRELEKNLKELTLFIPREDFDREVMNAYRKRAPKITVPGFRRGKAPKRIIEKFYGESYFYNDALDELTPDIYEKALEESGLDVVSRPEIELDKVDEEGVLLKAKVYVKPEVKLNQYKGLAAVKEAVTVEDSEIDAEVEAARRRLARVSTLTEGTAEKGDEALIDFEGFVDGVAFKGGKGEKHPLVLGSGSFIPGFEEQIEGQRIGSSFEVKVTFPEDYGEKALAGKEAVFKTVLHEVKRTELPDFDDEFVKDASEFNTVDEYKAHIKAKIEAKKEQAAEYAYGEALLDELLAHTEVEVPQPMIDDEVEMNLRDYDYRLRSQGGTLEMLLKYTGQSIEQLRESFRPQSERSVKVNLALDEVAKAEGLAATEEEVEAEYKKLAEGHEDELEKVKAAVPAETLKTDVARRKALEFIKANAESKKQPA